MKSVCCDLCGSFDQKILFGQTNIFYKTTKEKFKFVKCKNCGLCFTNPRPPIEKMEQFYPQGYGFHLAKEKIWYKSFLKSIISFLIDGSYHKKRRKLANVFADFIVFFLTRIKFTQ